MKKKLFCQMDAHRSETKIPQWERRYFRKKGITAAAMVMVLVVCLLVPAYAENNRTDGNEGTKVERADIVQNQSVPSDLEQISTEDDSFTDSQTDQVDKAETVYAKANADGTVRKVTVTDILKNPGDGNPIEDQSALKNIKNTEGEEEYKQNGEKLTWDNKGEDITYEGTTDKELPVKTNIRYFLNGKEMKPEKLAGKSGKVTIRFNYDNLAGQTVQVNGKDVQTITPFAVLSTVMLSEDHFSNIQVKNGKLADMNGQTVVIGYAFPGLAECLNLTDYKATKDVDIPDYVEIQADTTDFQLDFTATVITNGLLQNLEEDDLIRRLSAGSQQLTEGMKAFDNGIGQLSEGIAALHSGSSQLSGSSDSLLQGCAVLTEGLQALQKGMITFDEEGIQKIADLTGADLQEVLTQIRALKKADGAYENFSGLKDGQSGSVRFIVETDEISK